MIDIKDVSGNIRFSTPINEGSKRKFLLMKEDYLTLKFSLEKNIYFKLGDYVDIPNDYTSLFEICDIQKPTFNNSTGGHDYELRLDAYYWKWKNKIFKYTPEVGGQEASWNLTASLDSQLGVFLRNLKALGYTYRGKDFEFSIDSSVENKALLMSYDNTNMIDALSQMAETWDCEWWITNSIIHFGRCEFGDPIDFELGVNVEEMTRSDGQSTYATRIIAFGSTKNIPTNYRPADEQMVVNGVVQRRLMLPVGTPYVDAYEGMSQEEAVEDIVVFDDVHPKFIGTISEITETTGKYTDEDGNETGETYPIYTFKDTTLKNFTEDYLLDELRLKFESGLLNGLDFALTLKGSDDTGTTFEIVRNNDYGRDLPDSTLKPVIGDTYSLYGFDTSYISTELMDDAEQELLEKAKEYVAKTKIDPSTYDNTMMSDYIYNDGDVRVFEVGDRVNLINKGYFENGRVSRIIGFEYNLDKPYDSPIYTVGETAAYSRIGEIEDKVDSLTYKGQTYTGGGNGIYLITTNDKTQASDRNAYSAKRASREIKERSLSRLEKDTASGHITLSNGSTVENGLIVRLPKQNTPVALMSCLLEEDIDTLIEEDEDAIVEVAPAEAIGDITLGGLMNIDPAADEVDDKEDYVLVKLKGESEWTLLPASSIGGGGSGVQRNVLIQNDLDSRNISASKGEPCYLKFTFVSQERYGIGGDYENTGERGLCQISIKNTVNAEFTVVKQMYIQSGYSNTVDVAEFLSSGSNQIMIKVTGEITEMTTSAFVYTVQLTSLSIAADNFRWWTAFTGENITIPLNIGGNISKTLYVTITGPGYNKSYDVALGTAVYTETAYNYQLAHPDKSGIFNVSMYVANSDGSIRTRTISYNIICAVTGDAVKLIAINNVLEKATNWSENALFDYAMYDGSNAITSAQFTVKKDGSHVYSSLDDRISTSAKHTFSLPLEIETIDNADFDIAVSVTDGGTELTSSMTIPVNNSLGFSSVAGAVFYMNPRTRSNNQSNYQSVVNEMTGEAIPATWQGMNWGNDGWTSDADMNNVLRVMASARVDIGYKVFAKESARAGKTVEIDYKTDNVTDFNHPVIRMSSDGDSFVGLRVFPDNVIMYTNALKTTDNQSINLFEGKRLRLTLVIMPDAYGNPDFNLCIIYVNGVKNREFTYKNNDYFAQNSDIVIGSDYADVDIYGIRVYDSALTSEAVLRNYINWQVDNTEKTRIQEDNDVMDANGSEIDFENVKDQFNVMVFSAAFPSLFNPNKMKGVLEVFFSDHPEWNVSISNVEAKGQGTSSMRYWRWNVRYTLDKKLSIVTAADGSTSTGGWSMVPALAKATKITAKKNFASSMHSHKVGSVNSVDDLYRAMGYLNEAMQTEKYANARVAVYQLPFVAFEKSINDEGKEVYTFRGLYTMGPDKGDKNTFGHDSDLFPGLLSIEGADNSPLCTLFRVPWSSRMQYNEEEEAFQYNGANSWDYGAGELTNISKWIPAYNIAYQCSNRLKPFNGTLAELNAQVATYRNEPYEFWIAKTGDTNLYNVYYYEASEGRFIASDIGNGTINLKTQLSTYLADDLSPFTADQLNELFINARIQKFRAEAPQYWDIDDAILHRNWVEFHAGTDNRAKNTYPYCFGNAGSKWKWRYDDLDTIFDTDNQGQAKKGYYVEFHDAYDNGGSVWNGETSNFWNLLDLAFPDEVWAGMRKMMAAMEELSGVKSGTDFDKLYAYFQKYYFAQAQEYFPQNLYNADAKFTYEESKLAYDKDQYTNDTDPITQSLGDHYTAEQRWITKRILYMMSKYSFGLFSADGTDNITVRAAGNTIQYELTPAMDLYPAIANGTSIIRGTRTKAGEVCRMLIELSGSGDQQNTIQGASYLQDIGDWHDKNVTGSMIIQGRMLRDIRLGHATEPIVISITALTLSNCVSLQRLILSRISTLTGTLSLLSCTHLKEIYAGGTSLTQIVLPKGGGLETIEYSEFNQYITLQNYPLLKSEGVLMDYCKEKVTDFLVENCPLLKPMELLSAIIEAQQSQGTNHVLKHIRAVGFEEEYYSADALNMLANLADGTYEGLSAEGLAGEEAIPVLDGKVIVHSNYYQDFVNSLRNTFDRLELILEGEPAIYIADKYARTFIVSVFDTDNDGYVTAEEAAIERQLYWDRYSDANKVQIADLRELNAIEGSPSQLTNIKEYYMGYRNTETGNQMFYLNTSIEILGIGTNVVKVSQRTCRGCTNLKKVILNDKVEILYGDPFRDCVALTEISDIPDTCYEIGGDCFNGCSSLKSIVIGRGVTQISYSAFRNCTSMESLFIKTAIPPMLGNDAFTNNHCKIYVSIGSGAAYKAATNWSAYADRIYEYDF
nr:MAG TPA: tail protein [Caudoviricetes sp.]